MKKTTIAKAAALGLVLSLLAACAAPTAGTQAPESQAAGTQAPETQVSETQAVAPESSPDGAPGAMDGDTAIQNMYGQMQERTEEYAPRVTTLPSGVQVQRTPR